MFSLPGKEDPIRKKLYRSMRGAPSANERKTGAKELAVKLANFDYRARPLPDSFFWASSSLSSMASLRSSLSRSARVQWWISRSALRRRDAIGAATRPGEIGVGRGFCDQLELCLHLFEF